MRCQVYFRSQIGIVYAFLLCPSLSSVSVVSPECRNVCAFHTMSQCEHFEDVSRAEALHSSSGKQNGSAVNARRDKKGNTKCARR